MAFYYNLKSKGVSMPYFRTITAVAFFIGLNIMEIVMFLNIPVSGIPFIRLKNPKLESGVNSMLVFTPIIIALLLILKKKKLDSFTLSDSQIKKGNNVFIVYMACSILLLLLLLIREGIRKGTL